MAQLIVRNLEEAVKARLKRRAQRNGSNLEEEVRRILRNAVKDEPRPSAGLGNRISQRFIGSGLSAELEEIRGQLPRLPDFPA
jgi:plasmid stability protein